MRLVVGPVHCFCTYIYPIHTLTHRYIKVAIFIYYRTKKKGRLIVGFRNLLLAACVAMSSARLYYINDSRGH